MKVFLTKDRPQFMRAIVVCPCFIFYYKAELIHHRAPWKTKEAVELATLEWVA